MTLPSHLKPKGFWADPETFGSLYNLGIVDDAAALRLNTDARAIVVSAWKQTFTSSSVRHIMGTVHAADIY
jgi:isopentenyl diphosphate isomerase/L-lactate dehydrogenase-like FMN-dependent dehydrogenase